MTATTEPRGGLDLGWTPGEDGWGPAMNANLLRISRLGFHASVLSMTTTAPPGSPTNGAGYIIPAGSTGDWVGRAGQVAVWDGSAWAYAVPRDGWTVYVVGTGLVTYEDGAWSQANIATAEGIGAEPYAGVPAQTSFWRSTAAGVRAWVQLVAADITDLATTLAGYLTKLNPTYTGRLTGPTATLTEFGVIRNYNGDATRGAVYPTGVTVGANNWAMIIKDDGTDSRLNAATTVALCVGGASKVGIGVDEMNLTAGVALKMSATTVIDSSRNASFTGLTTTENPVFGDGSASKSITINGAGGGSAVASVNLQNTGVNRASMQVFAGTAWRVVARDTGGVEIDSPFYVDLVAGGKLTLGGTARTTNFKGAIEIGATTVIDSSRNITGTTLKGGNLTGAGDRPVATDLTGTLQPKTPDQFRSMISALAASLKGAANGVAELGADVKVPVAQLPSAALLALGETSATAYRGDRGKTAYDHSQVATGNPHGTTAADVGAAEATHAHSTGDITSGVLPTSRGGTGNNDLPSGFLISTNQYIQSMGLTDNTVPFYGGTSRGFWNLQFSSEFSISSGSDPVLSLAGIAWSKVSKTGAVAADIGAAKAPSKVDVSASTTLGSIDASAIKVTTTDVILTLSGGVDGQGWDIINPTTSTGIRIPSGATLWKTNGFDVGPTTIALGGGRPIRITRIDANTWIMLGSQ